MISQKEGIGLNRSKVNLRNLRNLWMASYLEMFSWLGQLW